MLRSHTGKEAQIVTLCDRRAVAFIREEWIFSALKAHYLQGRSMYLCTENQPHRESTPTSCLDSVSPYRALFSLDAAFRSLATKYSAESEKARMVSDMRLMRMSCTGPLGEAFEHALAVTYNMQNLTL
jgi:hypothetical protein